MQQIPKSRDLNVAGIVRRPEVIPELRDLGVDFVGVESPDLPKQIQSATGGIPISLGLDSIGGPAAATISSVLSPAAHFVSYAWLSGLPIHLPQGDLIRKRLNIQGFWMYYEEYLPKMRAALTEATQVVASGKLSLPITATYPSTFVILMSINIISGRTENPPDPSQTLQIHHLNEMSLPQAASRRFPRQCRSVPSGWLTKCRPVERIRLFPSVLRGEQNQNFLVIHTQMILTHPLSRVEPCQT